MNRCTTQERALIFFKMRFLKIRYTSLAIPIMTLVFAQYATPVNSHATFLDVMDLAQAALEKPAIKTRFSAHRNITQPDTSYR
jgi:hypothetical protein